jgi:hypothetical protein
MVWESVAVRHHRRAAIHPVVEIVIETAYPRLDCVTGRPRGGHNVVPNRCWYFPLIENGQGLGIRPLYARQARRWLFGNPSPRVGFVQLELKVPA